MLNATHNTRLVHNELGIHNSKTYLFNAKTERFISYQIKLSLYSFGSTWPTLRHMFMENEGVEDKT